MLAGNVVALLSPIMYIGIFTLIFGVDKYDWVSMQEIRKADDHDLADAANVDLELVPGEATVSATEEEAEQKALARASKIAKTMTVLMALALLVLWPFPMYGTGYIFSKPFFTGWVVVGIIWLFGSLFCVGLFPLYEGRVALYETMRAIILDIRGQHPSKFHRPEATYIEGKEEGSNDGADTPPMGKDIDGEKTGVVAQ